MWPCMGPGHVNKALSYYTKQGFSFAAARLTAPRWIRLRLTNMHLLRKDRYHQAVSASLLWEEERLFVYKLA